MRLRTVFISDIHLGFKGCSAEYLLEFLHKVEMDYLFLVGDIIDVWSMKKSMFWPQSHNNVVRTILGKAKRGTKVVFVPGNHDEVFRDFDGSVFGNLEIHREYVHLAADGRRMLVLHGDEFDSVVKFSPWLAKVGSNIYDFLLAVNPYINWVRRKFKLPHWSLASYLKNTTKKAVQYIGSFEDSVAQAARRRGVDAVVCGHIHRAEMRDMNGILYCNDGDWVESCTSLVEDMNGRLSLIDWPKIRERLLAPSAAAAAANPSELAAAKRPIEAGKLSAPVPAATPVVAATSMSAPAAGSLVREGLDEGFSEISIPAIARLLKFVK